MFIFLLTHQIGLLISNTVVLYKIAEKKKPKNDVQAKQSKNAKSLNDLEGK